MKATGCEFCVSAADAGGSIFLVFGGFAFLIVVVIPALKRNRQLRELFGVLARVLPLLLGDIQVRNHLARTLFSIFHLH
jgi:hypothetical protein|eukprot:COSAG02_NODE_44_length_45948_cov_81.673493_30_plen_79_part_00